MFIYRLLMFNKSYKVDLCGTICSLRSYISAMLINEVNNLNIT